MEIPRASTVLKLRSENWEKVQEGFEKNGH